MKSIPKAIAAASILLPGLLHADHVILDDCIIDGSLAVGLDSVNGENFGFDTIRVKENNLRFHFDDTSVSASFPRNDWRLIANDSANGGDSYLAIEDSTGGRVPFRTVAGAPSHSLYIDSQGDVGLGTDNPVVEAHISDGDTPTVRLEQNGSSGWNPQSWDVAGNETNFFIRDVTHGSKLPFRIRPDAPSSALEIEADGKIDIGVKMEIGSTAAELRLRLPDAGNDLDYPAIEVGEAFISSGNGLAHLSNNNWYAGQGGGWQDNNEDRVGALIQLNLDEMIFWKSDAGTGAPTFTEQMRIKSGGDVEASNGTFINMSDRNKKSNIVEVDTASVLDRLMDVPVSTWRYNGQGDITHLGPMAQDFWSAFELGDNDTSISTVDTAGVAFASIQELNRRLEDKDSKIEALEAHNKALEDRLQRIEDALQLQLGDGVSASVE